MYQHTKYCLISDYVDERKLFVVALGMQIAAMSVLTSIGFSWDYITNLQTTSYYIVVHVYVYHNLVHFIPPNTAVIISRLSACLGFPVP
jgi:hypothetical protein